MPSWNKKDERQYEHIKESQLEQDTPKDRAKEVAARTVNKQRREEDRTPNKQSQGSGNPNTRLEDRSVDELNNQAKEMDIPNRSKMNKGELVKAIRESR